VTKPCWLAGRPYGGEEMTPLFHMDNAMNVEAKKEREENVFLWGENEKKCRTNILHLTCIIATSETLSPDSNALLKLCQPK
jgi:hypothetical protein